MLSKTFELGRTGVTSLARVNSLRIYQPETVKTERTTKCTGDVEKAAKYGDAEHPVNMS